MSKSIRIDTESSVSVLVSKTRDGNMALCLDDGDEETTDVVAFLTPAEVRELQASIHFIGADKEDK